jgi:hypothetical protein
MPPLALTPLTVTWVRKRAFARGQPRKTRQYPDYCHDLARKSFPDTVDRGMAQTGKLNRLNRGPPMLARNLDMPYYCILTTMGVEPATSSWRQPQ